MNQFLNITPMPSNNGFLNQTQGTLSDLRELEMQIYNLQSLKKEGMINGVDTVIAELKKKELKLKEEKVLAVHTHKVTELSIMKRGRETLRWQTKLDDGSRPRCSSYEALINKLFEYYYGEQVLSDYSFRAMFEAALQEKIVTQNPKQKTIKDYWDSYHAFISDDFGAKDIRKFKTSELMAYIQEVTQRLNPTKKRLYKFKGLLNIVFRYACNKERRYITENPMPAPDENRFFVKNCTPTNNKPEDKAFQPHEIDLIREHLWKRICSSKYDVNGYAILFASQTGCREAEIPAIKWSDVSDKRIHIHAQLNDHKVDGKKEYYYFPCTKNEKGVSRDGRYIPMTDEIREILFELREKQKKLGINSEWVFAKEDGEWITTAGYYESLYRLCKKLGLKLSNNHAFRIALNSYVFIPMGMDVTTRARILGHSVQTNLNHYTFARTDEYLDEVAEKWNTFNRETRKTEEERGTSGYLNNMAI